MIHQITRAELIVIAARLKQAQDMVGYSNERMATMFGITEIQYSKILRGHSMITEDKLIILKQEMNISIDYWTESWKKCSDFRSAYDRSRISDVYGRNIILY